MWTPDSPLDPAQPHTHNLTLLYPNQKYAYCITIHGLLLDHRPFIAEGFAHLVPRPRSTSETLHVLYKHFAKLALSCILAYMSWPDVLRTLRQLVVFTTHH